MENFALAYWLSTTPTGREFAVRDDILARGAYAWVPRKVDPKRIPGKRMPVAIVAPLLPNYVLISCSDEQWHDIRDNVRGLWPEMTRISAAYWERRLAPYIEANDRAHDERLTQINAGERIEKFHDGDELQIILGGLTGTKAIFRGIVEDDTLDLGLKLVAEVGFIAGRAITMALDPAHVERVIQ